MLELLTSIVQVLIVTREHCQRKVELIFWKDLENVTLSIAYIVSAEFRPSSYRGHVGDDLFRYSIHFPTQTG